MTELATRGSALALRDDQQGFSPEQVAALRQMNGWNDVPDAELAVFFHQCARTGLDPFARQIYLIPRKEQGAVKWTVQTGIDGYRLIASRTGELAGMDRPVFEHEHDEDGRRVDLICAVTVYRLVAGQPRPFPGEARWSEYAARKANGEPTAMWKSKPRLMLAKCAEALALRRAFPAELSGIYTAEEMDQAQSEVSVIDVKAAEAAAAPSGGESADESSDGSADVFGDPEHAAAVAALAREIDAAPEGLVNAEQRERLLAYARRGPRECDAARRRLAEEVRAYDVADEAGEPLDEGADLDDVTVADTCDDCGQRHHHPDPECAPEPEPEPEGASAGVSATDGEPQDSSPADAGSASETGRDAVLAALAAAANGGGSPKAALEAATVVDLRAIAKERGLSIAGKKADVIDRLVEWATSDNADPASLTDVGEYVDPDCRPAGGSPARLAKLLGSTVESVRAEMKRAQSGGAPAARLADLEDVVAAAQRCGEPVWMLEQAVWLLYGATRLEALTAGEARTLAEAVADDETRLVRELRVAVDQHEAAQEGR